jgi:CDP-2,3-bis-(O-geranylgeranyl)-sn-glycerol synthase
LDFLLDMKLLALLAAANGTPVIAQNLMGSRWAHPLDGGLTLRDGQPLFGSSKTIRGIVTSLLATALVSALLGLGWQVGALMGAAAMAGDLCSSFTKRRMRLAPSSQATGLDQIPESLLPMLVALAFVTMSVADVAIVVACFFGGALAISRILYRFKLRNRPY